MVEFIKVAKLLPRTRGQVILRPTSTPGILICWNIRFHHIGSANAVPISSLWSMVSCGEAGQYKDPDVATYLVDNQSNSATHLYFQHLCILYYMQLKRNEI